VTGCWGLWSGLGRMAVPSPLARVSVRDFRHAHEVSYASSCPRSGPAMLEDMDERILHPSAGNADEMAALFDAAARQARPPVVADQACCCVAKAVMRVVMPPAPGRPHETELLLCGHHYRASRQALAAAHARVIELPGTPAETAAWFHGGRDRSPAPVG